MRQLDSIPDLDGTENCHTFNQVFCVCKRRSLQIAWGSKAFLSAHDRFWSFEPLDVIIQKWPGCITEHKTLLWWCMRRILDNSCLGLQSYSIVTPFLSVPCHVTRNLGSHQPTWQFGDKQPLQSMCIGPAIDSSTGSIAPCDEMTCSMAESCCLWFGSYLPALILQRRRKCECHCRTDQYQLSPHRSGHALRSRWTAAWQNYCTGRLWKGCFSDCCRLQVGECSCITVSTNTTFFRVHTSPFPNWTFYFYST